MATTSGTDAGLRAGEATTSPGWPTRLDSELRFVTPQLQKLIELWREKRDGRTMPARADFSMRDVRYALTNFCVLEIVREGTRVRFKVKLMGSELDTHVGAITGRFIDEAVPAKFAEKWSMPWRGVVETRQPMRSFGRVEFREKNYYLAETLHAPLAADGESPDRLMIVAYYHVIATEAGTLSPVARQLTSELESAA
jgi:hypothetical protein